MRLTPDVRGLLTPTEVAEVRDLVDAVTAADGVRPLSDHVMLHLPRGGDEPVRNVLLRDDDERLLAYAHLDVTDAVDGSSAELLVHPQARGRGLGRTVVTTLLDLSPDGRLRLWAHGQHPGAAALASALGFDRSRALWQMRRVLTGPGAQPLPEAPLPEGITVRTFEVGRDEQAWTEVNNRAFAAHPDQGGWGVDEVKVREAEPWFDAAGFFLAERDGRLVGSHWTKVHGAELGHDGRDHAHDPLGEVYVVGVDPSEQGRGLGPALTLLGLQHLRDRGLREAMLYVDESNTAAVRVYERLGFRRTDVDVMFSRVSRSDR